MTQVTATALWVDVWTKQYEYPERNAGIGAFTLRFGFRGKVGESHNCLFQQTVGDIRILDIWRLLITAEHNIFNWERKLKDENHAFHPTVYTSREGELSSHG